MKLLVKLYDKTLNLAQHVHAPRYLAAISFIESSVFPISPVFMLAPMALAHPKKAINYATIATIGSVLGGFLGYFLGYMVFKPIVEPVFNYFGYMQSYNNVVSMFQEHGFWSVLIAGFTPIPYKVIAISSGFVQVPLFAFFVASLIGRSIKFFAIAIIMKFGGAKIESHLRLAVEKAGFALLALVLGLCGLKFFKVI